MIDLSTRSDETWMRSAIEKADLNVLRMALYQLTGDPALARMRIEHKPARGGALLLNVLAPEHHAEVTQKALAWLLQRPARIPSPPAPVLARHMMEMFSGQKLTDSEFRYAWEELAFEDYPRDATWSREPPRKRLDEFSVAIIGAGISGIAAALQLKRLGIRCTVIERQSDIGGTWQLNDYPEARVDVSSFLYQFKFEKQWRWQHYYAPRDETQAYLKHIVAKHDIGASIVLDTEVIAATWDESTARWRLNLRRARAGDFVLEANVVISASGLFSTPNLPDIEGIGTFLGAIFHTTAWDHSFDYRGKRIALIGNGSSGVQLMPCLARAAQHLTVYQRTPNWIAEIEGYHDPVAPQIHWLFDNVPYYWNWYCYAAFESAMQIQNVQTFDPQWQRGGGIISQVNDMLRSSLTAYVQRKVGHRPDLAEKCTPRYAPLARRLVVDNGWFDALLRSNVDLVTSGIERITPAGIVSRDGAERAFDLVVLGAGFKVSQYLWPVHYRGRGGATLEECWRKDGARSYLGMTMPGFPNFFMFYGPNGQTRAGGFYSLAEVWARYVGKAIVALLESGHASIECRREVFEDYNARMDEEMKRTIWESEGAGSYYVNEHGRSGVNMPWRADVYHSWVIEPNLDDFTLR